MRTAVIAAVLLAAVPAGAQTRRSDAPIFGIGGTPCQQATAPDQIQHSREWLFGYLTAFGESFAPPSIWLGDADTVSAIFDDTCSAFPKFTLVEAAHWVILTLQDRKYTSRRK